MAFCPSADRSASFERSAASASVSIPSDVALSGKCSRKFSPISSSIFNASASVFLAAAAGAGVGSPVHPCSSGKVAVQARDAMASRRFIKGDMRTSVKDDYFIKRNQLPEEWLLTRSDH